MSVATGCGGAGPSDDVTPAEAGVRASAEAGTDANEQPETLCALEGPPPRSADDVLVFSDEFDGTSIDTEKWSVATGYKGHDSILNTTSPANVIVRDGLLSIRTERSTSDSGHPFVSGYVDSLSKYARTYGRIEFRARFPQAAGIWYAIWGRPWWQRFPEIDIELINPTSIDRSQLYFVNHWADKPLPPDERRSYVMIEKEIDFAAFHEYRILWRPGHLEWFVDGVSKMVAKPQGVPTKPVYWIINGWAGGFVGSPNETTPLPATFDVDYVRVYRVAGEIADPEIEVISPKTRYSRQQSITAVTANFDEVCSHVHFYDGPNLVKRTSQRPYRFNLRSLSKGTHELSFVATDGVRSTTKKMTVELD